MEKHGIALSEIGTDGDSSANIVASTDHPLTTIEDALARASAMLSRRSSPAQNPKLTDVGQVYFIQAGEGGPIKIGTTTNLAMRIKKLQQAQAEDLLVRALRKGGVITERKYHSRFQALRKRGEWFSPAPEILAEIDRLNALSTPLAGRLA